jgi:hypothetical protein
VSPQNHVYALALEHVGDKCYMFRMCHPSDLLLARAESDRKEHMLRWATEFLPNEYDAVKRLWRMAWKISRPLTIAAIIALSIPALMIGLATGKFLGTRNNVINNFMPAPVTSNAPANPPAFASVSESTGTVDPKPEDQTTKIDSGDLPRIISIIDESRNLIDGNLYQMLLIAHGILQNSKSLIVADPEGFQQELKTLRLNCAAVEDAFIKLRARAKDLKDIRLMLDFNCGQWTDALIRFSSDISNLRAPQNGNYMALLHESFSKVVEASTDLNEWSRSTKEKLDARRREVVARAKN